MKAEGILGEARRILVVEDDDRTRALIEQGLSEDGYLVEARATGETALAAFPVDSRGNETFDAIVLDVGLPGIGGGETCRRLRQIGINTPVLMLTARGSVSDRVGGLDAGADDYLVKPFHFSELLARLRALIRRAAPHIPDRLTAGDLTLDELGARVWSGEHEIPLTMREARVLGALMRRPNSTVTRATIADDAWDGTLDLRSNVVDVHIRSLRKKFGAARGLPPIETVRGVGYRLSTQSAQ